MESFRQGNMSIRVVSPDRPTKGSISLPKEPRGTSTREDRIADKADTSQGCGPTRHEPDSSTSRRNSSIGLSLLSGEVNDPWSQDKELPPASKCRIATKEKCAPRNAYADRLVSYRPLVGSGAAAAYEALRHDFYVQKNQSQRRMSSLSFGSAGAREFASKEPEFGPNNPNISNAAQCYSMSGDE